MAVATKTTHDSDLFSVEQYDPTVHLIQPMALRCVNTLLPNNVKSDDVTYQGFELEDSVEHSAVNGAHDLTSINYITVTAGEYIHFRERDRVRFEGMNQVWEIGTITPGTNRLTFNTAANTPIAGTAANVPDGTRVYRIGGSKESSLALSNYSYGLLSDITNGTFYLEKFWHQFKVDTERLAVKRKPTGKQELLERIKQATRMAWRDYNNNILWGYPRTATPRQMAGVLFSITSPSISYAYSWLNLINAIQDANTNGLIESQDVIFWVSSALHAQMINTISGSQWTTAPAERYGGMNVKMLDIPDQGLTPVLPIPQMYGTTGILFDRAMAGTIELEDYDFHVEGMSNDAEYLYKMIVGTKGLYMYGLSSKFHFMVFS